MTFLLSILGFPCLVTAFISIFFRHSMIWSWTLRLSVCYRCRFQTRCEDLERRKTYLELISSVNRLMIRIPACMSRCFWKKKKMIFGYICEYVTVLVRYFQHKLEGPWVKLWHLVLKYWLWVANLPLLQGLCLVQRQNTWVSPLLNLGRSKFGVGVSLTL